MLTHQIVITLTPALSLEGRGRKTNPHSLLSTFVSNIRPVHIWPYSLSVCALSGKIPSLDLHRHHNFADLTVGLHITVSLCNPGQRENTVNHGLQCA